VLTFLKTRRTSFLSDTVNLFRICYPCRWSRPVSVCVQCTFPCELTRE